MDRFLRSFFCLIAILLTANAHAQENERKGYITAEVSISAEGVAEMKSIKSALPENILEQLKPAFRQRAIEEQAEVNPGNAAEYTIDLEWKIVEKDGKEQMTFEFRENDLVPIVMVEPQCPCTPLLENQDVEVLLEMDVSEKGDVVDVRRMGADPDYDAYYDRAMYAVKRWKFLPRHVRGVARSRKASLPITFKKIGSPVNDNAGKEVQVWFRYNSGGEPTRVNVVGGIPDCLDASAIRNEIREALRKSPVADAVREGRTDLRGGKMTYPLPECPAP